MKRPISKDIQEVLQNKTLLQSVDLKKLRLNKRSLGGIDLSSADLRHVRFRKIDLRRANLSRANLEGSSFSKCDLREANFSEALCRQINLSLSDVTGTDFTGADLRSLIIYKTRMKKIILDDALLEKVNLSHMDLTESRAHRGNFRSAVLDSASLVRADFRSANFEQAQGLELKARQADFSGGHFWRANLEGSVLDGADFSQADLRQANLKLSSLRGVKLEKAKLAGADLRFCRGLTRRQKESLKDGGARLSSIVGRLKHLRIALRFPYNFLISCVLLIGLGLFLRYYFSNYHRFSTLSLQNKLAAARQRGENEQALLIDQELINRFERKGKPNSIFNRKMDLAQIYEQLGQSEQSVRILDSLLQDFKEEPDKVPLVQIALANLQARLKNYEKVISLLAHLSTSGLSPEQIFKAQLTLASALREEGQNEEAVSVYQKALSVIKPNPDLTVRCLQELSATYRAMGQMEKAKEILTGLPSDAQRSLFLLRRQKMLAEQFLAEKKYGKALMIYEKIVSQGREFPELAEEAKQQIRKIKKDVRGRREKG